MEFVLLAGMMDSECRCPCLQWLTQLLLGVDHLHSNYVLHRDLKVVHSVAVLTKSGESQEHNQVETEHKYYLYLPIEESMYLVIVTDKDCIIAYKVTLKLLHKLVYELSSGLNEVGILKSASRLIFAFDEVISPMGQNFDVDLDQVKTNLEMLSENELSHDLMTEMKISPTKEVMKHKAKEIDNKKMDAVSGASSTAKLVPGSSVPQPMVCAGVSMPIIQAPETMISASDPVPSLEFSSSESPGGSLQLQQDKGKEAAIFVEDTEAEIMEEGQSRYNPSKTASGPIRFTVNESIHVTRSTSGNITEFDLQGRLSIHIPVHLGALKQVQVAYDEDQGITYVPAEDIDKELFTHQRILSLENDYLLSHVRPNYGLNILHWNMTSGDKTLLPLLVDCTKTSAVLAIRFEALPTYNLWNVIITVRIPNLSEETARGISNFPGTVW